MKRLTLALAATAMALAPASATAGGDNAGTVTPEEGYQVLVDFYTFMCGLTNLDLYCNSQYNQPGNETGGGAPGDS